jgi:diguanylate cyclase (GGDEF)-like protein
VMLFVATFGVAASETVAHPASLVVSIALLVSITAVVAALSGAEVEQRTESVLDPLTGLLNRAALHRRFDELEQQARLTDDVLSLLVCDIDRFKAVNDTYGHDRGDAVLRDVAYEMRKQLRSFELIYRLGGEEFVLVLPGATDKDARRIAERLRESLRAARPGGLGVTVSVGVASARGERVAFESLFKEADRALYVAKANGRDRVVTAADVQALDAEALGSEYVETAAGARRTIRTPLS